MLLNSGLVNIPAFTTNYIRSLLFFSPSPWSCVVPSSSSCGRAQGESPWSPSSSSCGRAQGESLEMRFLLLLLLLLRLRSASTSFTAFALNTPPRTPPPGRHGGCSVLPSRRFGFPRTHFGAQFVEIHVLRLVPVILTFCSFYFYTILFTLFSTWWRYTCLVLPWSSWHVMSCRRCMRCVANVLLMCC